MHIERELKFRLPAQSASRVWKLLPGSPAVHRRAVTSVYYDTPDRRLRAGGAALRLRRDGRRWLMSFKAGRSPATGLAQRAEWEVAVARTGFAPESLPLEEIRAQTDIDLREVIPRLAPVFETRFTRRWAEITLSADTTVDVCLDIGRVVAGRRGAPIHELELELHNGDLDAMLEFADRLIAPLRLELEPESKAERGYRIAAAERPAPVKAQRAALTRSVTLEAAMQGVVGASLAQIEGNVYGVAHTRDPEYLHQLRVGMRRLRSAVRTFERVGRREDFLAPVAGLKQLTPVPGEARDWDVFCEGLAQRLKARHDEHPALTSLLRRARARRAAARTRARALVASARFQGFLLGVARWLHAAPWREQDPKAQRALARPVAAYAARAMTRAEGKVLRRGDGLEWTDALQRHQLRIRVKRLRYTCEPFAALYPRSGMRRYLGRLETLQDILGELNDIAVGRRLLHEFSADRDRAAVGFMRGWFAAREDLLVGHLAAAWRSWRKTEHPW
jgi:inorganic triphosphatase YgiF